MPVAEARRSVAEAFLAEHAEAKRKASTAEQYRDILERFVRPELGSRNAAKVTTADIAKRHGKMKRTPFRLTVCWPWWAASTASLPGATSSRMACTQLGGLRSTRRAGTTARYAHLDADPLRKASDRIGSQLAAAMGDVKPTSEATNGRAPIIREWQNTKLV